MGNCFECDNCIPIGEGDHWCDIAGLVIVDYEPSKCFGQCDKHNKLASLNAERKNNENNNSNNF